MIRRKSRSAAHRYVVRHTADRSAPPTAAAPAAEAGGVTDRPDRRADISGRGYEVAYSISSGYITDRLIVLP
jgi:hypothetical protein